MPSMYEKRDAPEARVSAVCLEASLLVPLVWKLFSTRKIFTPYDQKSSAIKIVSALNRRSAPPGTGRTGQHAGRRPLDAVDLGVPRLRPRSRVPVMSGLT